MYNIVLPKTEQNIKKQSWFLEILMVVNFLVPIHLNQFDSAIWKSDPSKRKFYIRYILRHQIGMGKTKEEIICYFGEDARIYTQGDRWSFAIADRGRKRYSLVFYFINNKVVKMREEFKYKE